MTLSGVVFLMFGLGFLMAPLYGLVCEITGIQKAGTYSRIDDSYTPSKVSDRTVKVKFDSTLIEGLPWEFRPLVSSVEVKLGEMAEIDYWAHNLSDVPVTGQAIPSVVPWQATEYFNKAECFCFQQQTLAPGEARHMPLRFVVSPDLPERVNSITLSYTFMRLQNASTKSD